MAEPLFLLADIDIGAAALNRWLKSAPLSVASFSDWPESLFRSDSGISRVPRPAEPTVGDELVAAYVASIGAGDGYLHCHYDDQAKKLHFAACFQYGDEAGVMEFAVFLCALLRGIQDFCIAKGSSFIRLSDIGRDLLRIAIDKKGARMQPGPWHEQSLPAWFGEWISQDNLGDPDTLIATLYAPLARALKKRISVGAIRANPLAPYRYDGFFWTDGKHVHRWPKNTPVPHADPKTFRRVTPANAMDTAFYADSRQLWYHWPMLDEGMVFVQSLEPGVSMQGWRPFGADGEPLLRCGDTVWAVAQMAYSDDAGIPGNTKANVRNALQAIQALGGIPVWEKLYNFEYLRPTRVMGASFRHREDHLFEDEASVYVLSLIHI